MTTYTTHARALAAARASLTGKGHKIPTAHDGGRYVPAAMHCEYLHACTRCGEEVWVNTYGHRQYEVVVSTNLQHAPCGA